MAGASCVEAGPAEPAGAAGEAQVVVDVVDVVVTAVVVEEDVVGADATIVYAAERSFGKTSAAVSPGGTASMPRKPELASSY